MTEQAHAFVDVLAKWLELVGDAIIIGGAVLAAFNFVSVGLRSRDWQAAYQQFRSNLGRAFCLV